MASQQQSPNRADDYTRTAKRLRSQVARIRGQAGASPQRQASLVDALNELVEHLILGHQWGPASPLAQEALRLSSATLFADGAVSNYTEPAAAARCSTALIHLATVQLGLGLNAPAGGTIASWEGLAAQLREYAIADTLSGPVTAWALYCQARSALDEGDVERANALVDALREQTGVREGERKTAAEAAPGGELSGFLSLDVSRLSAEARWRAGRTRESISLGQHAKQHYDALALGPLTDPDRNPKTRVERVAEPLFGLYRDHADRLAVTGDADLALVTRRALAELLRGLQSTLPEPAVSQLAATLSDLSVDLVRAHRGLEALEAGREAVAVAAQRGCSPSVRLLAHACLAEALLADGQSTVAQEDLLAAINAGGIASGEPVQQLAALVLERARGGGGVVSPALRASARGVSTWASTVAVEPAFEATETGSDLAAERERARREELQRRHEAQRAAEQRDRGRAETERAAEQARAAAAQEASEREARAERERDEAAEAERLDLKRRRAERLRQHAHDAAERSAQHRATRRAEIGELLTAAARDGGAGAETARLELELADLDRAELLAANDTRDVLAAADVEEEASAPPPPVESDERQEPVESDERQESFEQTGEPEAPRASAVPDEPGVPAGPTARDEPGVPEEPTVPEAPQAAAEPALAETPVPPAGPDELREAETALAQRRSEGNRKAVRQSSERLVELLRPRAQADPARYATRLVEALEELASLRLRGGDLFGSRAATKEAKALTKQR